MSTTRLTDEGLIVAAPPCSMFGPACSSVHRRSLSAPQGDLRNFKVRLSNRIWMNFVTGLHWVRTGDLDGVGNSLFKFNCLYNM